MFVDCHCHCLENNPALLHCVAVWLQRQVGRVRGDSDFESMNITDRLQPYYVTLYEQTIITN